MKKLIALLLAVCLMLALVACGNNGGNNGETQQTTTEGTTEATNKVLTYAEYAAIEVVEGGEQPPVIIECYVQDNQNPWDNKVTVYGADRDGAYFMYNMACSEADAAKLVPGTKIRVTGYKTVFEGEYEIVDATFEFIEGADTYIAEPMDATALLGKPEMENHMNKLATFKAMTIEQVEYRNGAPGDDIYVTLNKDGNSYKFCVEVYLTGPDTDVYKAFETLKAGDIVDVECFLYYYKGLNAHITAISLPQVTNS